MVQALPGRDTQLAAADADLSIYVVIDRPFWVAFCRRQCGGRWSCDGSFGSATNRHCARGCSDIQASP
ncbi:protein of unknown function [Burkholderia multivorans]